MSTNSDTYRTLSLPLKTIRKRKKISQSDLAKVLKVSQSQISQWEINGRVPSDRFHDISTALDIDWTLEGDLEICADIETVEAWKNFFRAFSEHRAEGRNPFIDEYIDAWGIHTFIGPLVDAGFTLPPPPKYLGTRDELGLPDDDDQPFCVIEYPDPGTEYFFSSEGPFNEFWLNHCNFREALEDIQRADEITDDAYLDLNEADTCGYVWAKIFKLMPLERYPLPQCGQLIERFEPRFLHTLNQQANDFAERVFDAWIGAYRSNDSYVNKPTWLPQDFLNEAYNDIGGDDVVFCKIQLGQGYSPDPFVRDMQKRLRNLEQLVAKRSE